MKTKIITLLMAFACASSLPAAITINVTNNVPNGTASGGSGTGAGLFTTSVGSIATNHGMPITTYTVSNLDFTSLGGTANESFTFTLTYTATSDGVTPASPQFNTFGNVSVTGGNSNQVDGDETLTATIALATSTFPQLSLKGLTQARAGGASGANTGTITWVDGSHAVSSGNTIANLDPENGYTWFTLTVDPTRTLNVEGFSAQFTAIPEPSTTVLVAALGLGAFVLLRRRRKA